MQIKFELIRIHNSFWPPSCHGGIIIHILYDQDKLGNGWDDCYEDFEKNWLRYNNTAQQELCTNPTLYLCLCFKALHTSRDFLNKTVAFSDVELTQVSYLVQMNFCLCLSQFTALPTIMSQCSSPGVHHVGVHCCLDTVYHQGGISI